MNDVKIRTRKGVWTLKKWKPAWILYSVGGVILCTAVLTFMLVFGYILTETMINFFEFLRYCISSMQ